MSFILDALKKSESERQRYHGPSLVDVPARRRPAERPWWVIVLGALLLLNLVVFVIVLLRKHDEPVAAAANPPVTQVAPVTQPPAPAPAPAPQLTARAPMTTPPLQSSNTGDPAVRSLAEEAGVAESDDIPPPIEPDLSAAANAPAGPPIVSPIRGPDAAPVRTAPSTPSDQSDEILPTLNDMAVGGTQVPPLHLDIHVYATSPADRFVFINMKKYREGDTTAEGMQVERIRRDGVVLNHEGRRFLLPRQ